MVDKVMSIITGQLSASLYVTGRSYVFYCL